MYKFLLLDRLLTREQSVIELCNHSRPSLQPPSGNDVGPLSAKPDTAQTELTDSMGGGTAKP